MTRRDERRRATGRPLKPVEPGTRVSLGLKVTPAIKEKLDASARINGRTQSQEAEVRLERSFTNQGLLFEVLELAYGPDIWREVMLFGDLLRQSSLQADLAELAGGTTKVSFQADIDPETGSVVQWSYEDSRWDYEGSTLKKPLRFRRKNK